MYTFGIKHLNVFVYYFLLQNDYDVETWYMSAFLINSKFTFMLKIAWNKHGGYKENHRTI